MNTFVSILVLLLQRVPFVNRLSFVRDAGTIEAALKALTKASAALADVAANQRAAEAQADAFILSLEDEREAAKSAAERAERVAEKLRDLLT